MPEPRSETREDDLAAVLHARRLAAPAPAASTSLIQNRNVNAPGPCRRGAVEDDVVGAGCGQDRARGEDGLAERAQVRVEVERQRGVAGQAALVAGVDDPRLDADALARGS